MKNTETVLQAADGLEIIKIHVPPNCPDRLEHYHLYRVGGWKPLFLSASKAWAKAKELQDTT